MKTFFLLMATTLSSQIIQLPQEFYIEERFLSFISTFDIHSSQTCLGSAVKQSLSFTTTFDLQDVNDSPLAKASSHFFAWGTIADITDPEGNKIGWIEEEIFRLIAWSEFRVFNQVNQLVAIAKMNIWGTEFVVYHPDDLDHIYATISRPFFRLFRDVWTVRIQNREIFDTGIIDPRLLLFLSLYQTDKDNRDRIRNQFLDQILQDNYYNNGRKFN